MGLNPNYMLAPSLQEYFVDKDTGLPLAGGKVYFYEDDARSVLKPVYEISGTPPNYVYTVLPNPVTLTANGTFSDGSGNDILPYYYPFDSSGNIQLYYVAVYNSNGVFQFSREGWPNFTDEAVNSDNEVTNFVPNGQFLIHNNIPATSANGNVVGKISATTTILGDGGWSYVRTSNTPTDIITFTTFTSSNPGYTSTPRYALRFQCQVANSDTQKDITLTFPDVNKFSSSTQLYNLYFEAQSLTGADLNNIQVLIIKNYGTGGSPTSPVTINVSSVAFLSNSVSKFNVPLLFGTNAGAVFGTNNDDTVSIVLRFPASTTFIVEMTNFALTINDATLSSFPVQTNSQQLYASTCGAAPTPDPNGQSIGLYVISTNAGWTYDTGGVGNIISTINTTAPFGWLNCDGTQYLTTGYSSDGIPYSRLQAKLWINSISCPMFGTGTNFGTSVLLSDNSILITTNKTGSATASSAGTTTFTVSTIHTGGNYNLKAYVVASNAVEVQCNSVGFVNAPTAGTTAFSVSQSADNNSATKNNYSFSFAALPSAGEWFGISNQSTDYYIWFKVDGSGADPAPGGRTGILVSIKSTYNTNDLAIILANVISGAQQTSIITVSGASISDSQYFSFFTSTPAQFNPWYNVTGSATAPATSGTNIQVNITSGDTAAQVASKTVIAINNYYFAVPDLRGYFIRGWNNGSSEDPNASSRLPLNKVSYFGDLVGTLEFNTYTAHVHSSVGSNTQTATSTNFQYTNSSGSNVLTSVAGYAETRPDNISLNYIIKY